MKDSFFTLTFFPRKPRTVGDGEYPLYVRITTEDQKTEFTIGRKVQPTNWAQRAQKSTGRSRRDIELNWKTQARMPPEAKFVCPLVPK